MADAQELPLPPPYTAFDCTVVDNMRAFECELMKMLMLYCVTSAHKSTLRLEQLKRDVFTSRLIYMRRVEQAHQDRPPTRQLLIDSALAVRAIRVPPTLRHKRAEIEAIRARLTELAASSPE